VTVYPTNPIAFHISNCTEVIDWSFLEYHPILWDYEDQGNIIVNHFATAIVNAKRAQIEQGFYFSQLPAYNVYVFREKDSTITVYLIPGSTDPNVVFLGGDCTTTLSADGSKILKFKKLHNTILNK
jgi:hypothetical protein